MRWLLSLVFLLAPLAGAFAAEPNRPFVVGHRGLMLSAPENTLAGFRACLALKVGFEFDIQRSKDGELVCLHDATLDRTTNGMGNLADKTFAELRQLDAGAKSDARFRGERIPTVDEVFAMVAKEGSAGSLIAVDMKDTGRGIEEAVVRLAERHKVLDKLIFIGATIELPDVQKSLKAASAQSPVARLAKSPEELGDAISDKGTDWVYVRFLPTPADIERIHKAGKRVFIAGPLVAGEETANWAKAATLGIDAVLTDHPLTLSKRLGAP